MPLSREPSRDQGNILSMVLLCLVTNPVGTQEHLVQRFP